MAEKPLTALDAARATPFALATPLRAMGRCVIYLAGWGLKLRKVNNGEVSKLEHLRFPPTPTPRTGDSAPRPGTQPGARGSPREVLDLAPWGPGLGGGRPRFLGPADWSSV